MIRNAQSGWERAYNVMEDEYRALRTRSERSRRGLSSFPEFNVGVWFDKRNAYYDQPNHPIWRGNDQWGLSAPCRLKFLGADL